MPEVKVITDVVDFRRSVLTAATGSTVPNKVVTASLPASTTNSVVVAPPMNYMKMKLHSGTTAALTVSVFGWSYYAGDGGMWVPQLLCTLTTTQGGSSQTIPGIAAAQREVTLYELTSGDAKIFNSPLTVTSGAFVVIDTLGSQYVEIYATAASTTPTVHVWTASL
jgi:hypothetical protein